MRSVQIPRFGLENLTVVETEQPDPGPGQIVVRVQAASINYRDFLIAQGFYKPDLELPLVPLSDGAGEVVAVGNEVRSIQPGDRVASAFWHDWEDGPAAAAKIAVSTGCEAPGMASDCAVLPESAAVPLPANISYADAAASTCAGLTAWTAVTTIGHIGPGDSVLLLGTGGVSIFALQFAKALGAKAIITSSSQDKLERAKELGADHGINYNETADWGKVAFGLAGLGVNCVVETGGAGTLPQSIEALGWDGHIAYLGQLAGMSGEINLIGLVFKGAHIDGVMVGSRAEHVKMLDFMAEHAIQPVIDQRFALEDTAAALAAIPAGQHIGKILVTLS